MKRIIYFLEFILIKLFFIICKLLGYRFSSDLGFYIGKTFGNFFRKKKSIIENLRKSKISIDISENKFAKNVLGNYGRILAEYPFLKDFRNNNLSNFIEIDGIENLEKIKKNNKPVVFISGHFNNFELMAMQIEKSEINLAAIYRPLNNIFLNKIMERIRLKYICKNQIKKGKSGTREMLKLLTRKRAKSPKTLLELNIGKVLHPLKSACKKINILQCDTRFYLPKCLQPKGQKHLQLVPRSTIGKGEIGRTTGTCSTSWLQS